MLVILIISAVCVILGIAHAILIDTDYMDDLEDRDDNDE